ncbi:MAG: hypothetical protein GY749_40225 [Desulfobacteraceae bacterium]|nr:hypothetical protein [Desulfobacteraceae bacterium]
MKTVQILIPDEIAEIYSDIEELKQTIIEDFVAGEFKKGNISIRQGADILGLTYEEFMVSFLGKREISFISGTTEELESEFRQEEKWLDEILESR